MPLLVRLIASRTYCPLTSRRLIGSMNNHVQTLCSRCHMPLAIAKKTPDSHSDVCI